MEVVVGEAGVDGVGTQALERLRAIRAVGHEVYSAGWTAEFRSCEPGERRDKKKLLVSRGAVRHEMGTGGRNSGWFSPRIVVEATGAPRVLPALPDISRRGGGDDDLCSLLEHLRSRVLEVGWEREDSLLHTAETVSV